MAPTEPRTDPGSLTELRLKGLDWSLYVGAVLKSIGVYAVSVEVLGSTGSLPMVSYYVGSLLLVYVLAFARGLGFRLRATGLIFVLYMTGLADLWNYGIASLWGLAFVTAVVFAALLFGYRQAAVWLAVTIASYLACAYAYASGAVAVAAEQQHASVPAWNWISPGIVYLYCAALTLILSSLLMNRLRSAIWTGEETVARLADQVTERATAEALALEKEQELATILRLSPVGILRAAADGRIAFANSKARELLGRDVDALSGSDWLSVVHPDDRERVRQAWEEGAPRGGAFGLECRIARDEGDPVWVYAQGSVLGEPGAGEATAFLATLTDLTDRKKAESRARELEGQLRQVQRLEAVGQLAGGVAHDFNNLLTVITMSTGLAREEETLDPAIAELLEEVAAAGERGRELVSQLLAFSRRQVMRPDRVDLDASIGNMTRLLRRVIGEQIELEFSPCEHRVDVWADEGMIEQVVMNLCVNARDAMLGGGRLRISTRLERIPEGEETGTGERRPGAYGVIRVEDTGQGIEPAVLPHIFEPFFTTKGRASGTGLGLATVFGIVRQHDGWTTVSSEVGAGTAFEVYLPVSTAPHERAARSTPDEFLGGNELILYAEDNAMVRRSTERVLRRAGYEVLSAEDGERAVALFEERADEVGLVLLDVVMPKMGGPAVLERVRDRKPGVPVLLATGYAGGGEAASLPDDLKVEVLQKPLSPSELLGNVRRLLDAAPHENATPD